MPRKIRSLNPRNTLGVPCIIYPQQFVRKNKYLKKNHFFTSIPKVLLAKDRRYPTYKNLLLVENNELKKEEIVQKEMKRKFF